LTLVNSNYSSIYRGPDDFLQDSIGLRQDVPLLNQFAGLIAHCSVCIFDMPQVQRPANIQQDMLSRGVRLGNHVAGGDPASFGNKNTASGWQHAVAPDMGQGSGVGNWEKQRLLIHKLHQPPTAAAHFFNVS
jgi:hypothetical protein